ncbi:MAG: hypothetical protein ISS28_04005 [Candidatus Cloacimonetes bacterium]|nr:hypothetical protein [Candidatus Cloacimonadota bacterium]MBL7086249.1 hypothetical protein [Candidatus Cloacimonadota bacterium]
MFISLTQEDRKATKRVVATKALTTDLGIVIIFCILGKLIFELFGITIRAL